MWPDGEAVVFALGEPVNVCVFVCIYWVACESMCVCVWVFECVFVYAAP